MDGTQGLRPGLHSCAASRLRGLRTLPHQGRDVAASRLKSGLLDANRMFHRHWGQPAEAVRHLATNNAVELMLNGACDGSHDAFADADLVDRANGSDFRRRTAKENFIGKIKQFAGYALFDYRNSEIARDLQNRVAGNAGQHGVSERGGLNHTVADHKNILARALADV